MQQSLTDVLFLAHYFPPAGGAGVQRAHYFVRYLPCNGFQPSVVAAPLAKGDLWAPEDRTLADAVPSDVRVRRVPGEYPTYSSAATRFRRWFALPSADRAWWTRATLGLVDEQDRRAKLVFATMSPFESATAAARIAQRLRLPWVADLRDPWALDDMQTYASALHRYIDLRRMGTALSSAAVIIMNTPQAAADVVKSIPKLQRKRVTCITNGYDHEDFEQPAPRRSDGKFRIVHSGIMLSGSGLQFNRRSLRRMLGGVQDGVDIITRSPMFLMAALTRWFASCPSVKSDVELLLAGMTTAADREIIAHSPARDSVRFMGYVPHRESVDLIRTADLLFLAMHNIPPGRRCRMVPGKTYEYMATGRPILAAIPDGDARDFLARYGNALICRPDDVDGMVDALREAYRSWRAGQPIGSVDMNFVRGFERRRLTAQLAQVFRDVI